MDIAALATSMTQMDTQNRISTAVARKTLDSQKQQGDAAVALIQAAMAVAPGSPGSLAAVETGVGVRLDARG